jgi:large subunit ribosomal protein L15
MRIHELQKSKWFKDKERRRWRWNGTGTGNYSGRGLKGQKSRSWFSMKPFFEGWQTSIVQRLPKSRGFTRYYKLVTDVCIINLGVLDADPRISNDMEINKQVLKDLGYIKSITAFVKLLWHGDYAKKLTFKDIDAFSASAKVKMDKPGTVHSVFKGTPVKVVKDSKSKVWKLKIKTLAEKNATKVQLDQKAKVEKVEKIVPKKVVAKKAAVKKAVAPKKVVTKPAKEDKVTVKKPAKEDKAVVKKTIGKKATK